MIHIFWKLVRKIAEISVGRFANRAIAVKSHLAAVILSAFAFFPSAFGLEEANTVGLLFGGAQISQSDDLHERAKSGDAEAQFKFGMRIFHGLDRPRSHVGGVRWYRLAAEQGHAGAQTALGAAYTYGLGVPQNHAKAIKWYRLAAEQGHDDAQYNLGVVYETGEGVPINYQKAYVWFSIAAANGNTEAAALADRMRWRLSPAQRSNAQQEADRLYAEIQRNIQESKEGEKN